jgi:ATP-binding cassette, subfamily G (WHITE), member 2, PDR
VAGEYTVSGDRYIRTAFSYTYGHFRRNFGILLGFLFGFMFIYFLATELNSSKASTAEVLVFRRGHVPKYMDDADKAKASDEELGVSEKAVEDQNREGHVDAIPAQTDVFTWRDVVHDIKIKGEPRRLLGKCKQSPFESAYGC